MGRSSGKNKIVEPAARNLAGLAAENFRHAWVGVADYAIGVDHPDAFAGSLYKMLLPVFALRGTFFREPQLAAIEAEDNWLSSVEQVVNPRAGVR